MITRQDYLEGRATHEQYYGEICADYYPHFDIPFVESVALALERGDEHLNSIPLVRWDARCPRPVPAALAAKFRERGDYATAAGLVCVMKFCARRAVLGDKQ